MEKKAVFYNNSSNKLYTNYLPKSYFAEYHKDCNTYNVVLRNLEDAYFQTEYPMSPEIGYCLKSVEALATVHSFWWNSPRLAEMADKGLSDRER